MSRIRSLTTRFIGRVARTRRRTRQLVSIVADRRLAGMGVTDITRDLRRGSLTSASIMVSVPSTKVERNLHAVDPNELGVSGGKVPTAKPAMEGEARESSADASGVNRAFP
jgi:hypothetical protein